ncbi:MAG: hypothetical protein HYY24_10855 [Verrucomicrobia bacterium]|nr:hypothetical protein [Verrucomicrobiota bacterium]
MTSAFFTSRFAGKSPGWYFKVVNSSRVGGRFQPPPVLLIHGTSKEVRCTRVPCSGNRARGASVPFTSSSRTSHWRAGKPALTFSGTAGNSGNRAA